MLKYTYDYLKKAARDNTRIGTWKGIAVYACSKYKYDAANSLFYVLYDDGNKLVKEGYCYGSIDINGIINEEEPIWYNVPSKPSDVVTKVVPASGYSAQVISDEFFSNLDKEINKLLADVGSYSPLGDIGNIDLLAGFEMDLNV